MIRILLMAVFLVPSLGLAHSKNNPEPEFYRELTDKIRPDGHFRIYMPNGEHQDIRYHFKFASPAYPKPIISDVHIEAKTHAFFRNFYDRIYFDDESYLEVGGERIPLTCVYVSGQDNRFSASDSPLIPEFIMRIYLVANDYSCQGPIRKGWPKTGGNKEAWDTYMHYEVRDPTIMLPQDALLRYRWNEFNAVLIDEGG